MSTSRTLAALAVVALTVASCGGSDSGGDADAAAAAESPDGGAGGSDDELGGAGPWTAEQLCALSTPDAVEGAFAVPEVEERPGADPAFPSCSWIDASDPSAQRPMGISLYTDFTSERLGEDETLDIPGADLAGFSENVGGAATVTVVVGTQALEITFPVGAAGAKDFGSVIASLWVAQQTG